MLYEGDNDLALGRSPQQVLADYREFVRLVRDSLPRARIVFIGIKPSPSRWKLVDQQREANRLVRGVVATDTLLSYVDVFDADARRERTSAARRSSSATACT